MTGSPLSTASEVRRVAQLSNNHEIDDAEIDLFIVDVDNEIRMWYGDPMDKTRTHIQFSGTSGSTSYDFTGDDRPVFRLDSVEVDGTLLVPTGSFTANLDIGEIDFNSSFLDNFDGDRLDFEFVPMSFHLLSTYLAALYLLESTTVISGENVRHPRIAALNRRVESIKELLQPKGAWGSGEFVDWDPRQSRLVIQDFIGIF